MANGPQDERDEQVVNPSAILQAMQTAIAQELRGRNEAPVSSKLFALLDRLKERQSFVRGQSDNATPSEKP